LRDSTVQEILFSGATPGSIKLVIDLLKIAESIGIPADVLPLPEAIGLDGFAVLTVS